MIGFFKKILLPKKAKKNLDKPAGNIETYLKMINFQIGETQKILLDISDKLEVQIVGMKPLQKYFDYELKRMREMEAEEKLPPGKHDYDF